MQRIHSLACGIMALTVCCSIVFPQTGAKPHRACEEGVTPPKVLYKTEPGYTEAARNAKIEGAVVLSMEIDTDGLAQNVRVIQGLDGGLDQSAMAAVSQWRFKPGEKDNKPVVVEARIEVNFRLK
jgi:protein TonB